MSENIIEQKSFDFSVQIVRLYQRLTEEQHEYVLSRQLLRAGTSIRANIAEAQRAQSSADFIAKLSIAEKEASETAYWLKLLTATDYLTKEDFSEIYSKADELLRLLASIIKTTRYNSTNHN